MIAGCVIASRQRGTGFAVRRLMFPLEEGFGEPWFPISTTGLIILLAAVAFGGLAGVLFLGTILEAVAAAGDGDQLGVV